MSGQVACASVWLSRPFSKVSDYIALTKPRIVAMVLVTTAAGFYLAEGSAKAPLLGAKLLLGTAFAAGGTLALNQFMERRADAMMRRTCDRPLPAGRLAPNEALVFGGVLMVVGWLFLAITVGLASALVTFAISAIYLGLYTPMKYHSPRCTIIGAISGALPPVAGWAAVRTLDQSIPWLLFAIMFFWQFPHTFAIAELYRDDFARANIRFLPVCDETGELTARRIVESTVCLLVVSALPVLLKTAGLFYEVVAGLMGMGILVCSCRMALAPRNLKLARQVLFATLVYLPLTLIAFVVDKT